MYKLKSDMIKVRVHNGKDVLFNVLLTRHRRKMGNTRVS